MMTDPDPFASTLMMREMMQPTAACVEVVREYIRPMANILHGLITELVPGADATSAYLLGFSVVSQCLFYKQSRPVARLLMGEADYDALTAERVADHVFAFALGGLGVKP